MPTVFWQNPQIWYSPPRQNDSSFGNQTIANQRRFCFAYEKRHFDYRGLKAIWNSKVLLSVNFQIGFIESDYGNFLPAFQICRMNRSLTSFCQRIQKIRTCDWFFHSPFNYGIFGQICLWCVCWVPSTRWFTTQDLTFLLSPRTKRFQSSSTNTYLIF